VNNIQAKALDKLWKTSSFVFLVSFPSNGSFKIDLLNHSYHGKKALPLGTLRLTSLIIPTMAKRLRASMRASTWWMYQEGAKFTFLSN